MNGLLVTRNCFNCPKHIMCGLYHTVKDAQLKWGNVLNIDGDAAPGKYNDIFIALANDCLEFTH
jgi:hypothetical protein